MEYGITSKTGESADELYERASQVIKMIRSIETSGNILVVGHSSFLSVIFAIHHGVTKDSFIKYRRTWHLKNAEIKELDLS